MALGRSVRKRDAKPGAARVCELGLLQAKEIFEKVTDVGAQSDRCFWFAFGVRRSAFGIATLRAPPFAGEYRMVSRSLVRRERDDSGLRRCGDWTKMAGKS